MSYRASDHDKDTDDYDYSDDSFISEDEKPKRSQSLNRTRKTTAPKKDDSRGRGRGKGRGKQRSTSQATPRVDPVIQRVLSARKLRINELRNNMEDLIKQIEDLKEENKLLKKTQYRQEKALNRFEDRESDLPQIMQRHNNETRTMREQLKKTKEKYERTDRYLRDAEDELDKVKNKMKKFKKLVDENDLLERDDLQSKVRKAEIDMEEKDVKIKDLERHVNNLSKNHRHELGIEMARTRESKKQMEALKEENERLERQLKEKIKELEMKNIYANRMSKPGSRMMPNSYSGTPMRQQSPSSPRRRRPPSVHDLNPREKVKLYEERRKEEERKQREKRAIKSKAAPGYRGGSLSPRKPVSTEPVASKKEDYPSKPWRSSRQVQSERPRGSQKSVSDKQRPFLYDDKKSKANDKPSKFSWGADDSNGGNRTPSVRSYGDDFERAPSAGSKEWERIEEDKDDIYSKPFRINDKTSPRKSPRHEKSTFTAAGKKWPWEKTSENSYNVSKKPPAGSTRIYASPPSGKSRYKSLSKKSTIASTSTYTAGETQQQQKAQEEREARERERKYQQEQEEEYKRKERWEHMERVRREQEEREREEREEEERRRRDREEDDRREREEKDRREAEEWKMKLEREKMKREAEELRREQEERQRRERERKEQERRAEEERERIQKDKQMEEERRKKDLLLAKLRDIDEGKKERRDESHDPFFLTNKADSDVGSTSSSKKSYQFTKPVENLHHGKWSHEDVTVPYLEKQKKKKEKDDDVGGYQPSFGRRGDPKKTTGKKTGGDVVFNDDFAKPPKPKENKKKDLMADLFGNQATTKTSNTFGDDDIFNSNFDKKKTNTAKLSLFDDEPKQTTTKRENSLSLFGGGSALLDDDTTTKDSSKLLPRRQRHTTTFQSRPAVTAVEHNFDDDIEEVIL